MFASKDIFLKSSGGYQISRSVRLRSSASAYFNRTPSASSRTTWTWVAWVKRGKLGSAQVLFSAGTGTAEFRLTFTSSDTIEIYEYTSPSYNWQKITTAVYRDPSAWYQIQLVYDSTNGTAADRVKLYVNGVQVTSFGTNTNPTSSFSGYVNSAVAHGIGSFSTGANYLDGYLTEINFIDGQALTPSSFGETNSVTGVWQPKRYAGTYGTNGFYLNFSDNSGVTATTIGKDYSGNGNNWTPNNISVTAGATYDSMLDVPTLYADGGNGRGNYATLNALQDNATLVNGNLDATSLSSYSGRKATMQLPTTGKWYWETTVSNTSTTAGNWFIFGMVTNSFALTSAAVGAANAISFGDRNDSVSGVFNETTTVFSSASINFATNDILQCAYDADSGKFWFGKNNSWYDSSGTTTGNPATGSNQTLTASAKEWFPFFQGNNTSSAANLNFGQRAFAHTAPSGFKALNTQNLPASTISNGANYMAATTYTGTGSALSVSNAVNGVSFQPDLVWVKGRSGATDHALYDAVRGVQNQLESNTTTAETAETTGLTAFGTTGFTIGALAQMNTNAATYVGWQWNAGGSTVTNTSGTISSQVRANPTAGFSVVTYTGTGSAATVGHGLGVAPSMIIVKNRNTASYGWFVWHTAFGAAGNTDYINLNLTDAKGSGGAVSMWNTTMPTSSVFSLGTYAGVNGNTNTYVAYLFAAVAGYSAFGSYTGNGSADGVFVFLGLRARFLMIKRTDSTGGWVMLDTARDTYNDVDNYLYANSSAANAGSSNVLDINSNGFKIRNSWTDINASGGTYVYMAFAENPFKLSLAR